MSSSIYVVGQDNSLTRLVRANYDSEDLLQRLLADHPTVLGLDQEEPQQLLLIKREQEIPDSDGGSGRWSLDHLFIDRDAVPILVEVKRASDSRIRREVVGQMLDYAANGVAYWPLAQLIEAFQQTCQERGEVPDVALQSFLGEQRDPEIFWRQVESNLRSGRIRMIFVADRIPRELRRIVEFLNEQMRPAEVLAIEIEQFVGQDGLRTLVPNVVGRTERSQSAKSVPGSADRLTPDQWLAELAGQHGDRMRAVADKVIGWFREQGCRCGVTESRDSLYFSVPLRNGNFAWPFFLRRTGKLEVSLRLLRYQPAFASDEDRREILDRLKAIPGVSVTTQKLTGWPAVSLAELARDDVWQAYRDVARWIISRLN